MLINDNWTKGNKEEKLDQNQIDQLTKPQPKKPKKKKAAPKPTQDLASLAMKKDEPFANFPTLKAGLVDLSTTGEDTSVVFDAVKGFRDTQSKFEQLTQDIRGNEPLPTNTQMRMKKPGTLENAMALYDVLHFGRPTRGFDTGDKEAQKKRNQFLSSIKVASEMGKDSFEGVDLDALITSIYTDAKAKIGDKGAMDFLRRSGLIPDGEIVTDPNKYPYNALAEGVDPRTGKPAMYLPSATKVTPNAFGGFDTKSPGVFDEGYMDPAQFETPKAAARSVGAQKPIAQDVLDNAGLTPFQKAFLKDNPGFGDIDNGVNTYLHSLQAVVNPFTTITQSTGTATSDLPLAGQLAIIAGDFIFQIAVGGYASGAAESIQAGRVGQTALKLFSVDNLMDLPDWGLSVQDKGFVDGTTDFALSMANQFNPLVLLDSSKSPQEKMITALSLATLGAGSVYSKVKGTQIEQRLQNMPSLEDLVGDGGIDNLPPAIRGYATNYIAEMLEKIGVDPESTNPTDEQIRKVVEEAGILHAGQTYHLFRSPKQVEQALKEMIPGDSEALFMRATAIAALDQAKANAETGEIQNEAARVTLAEMTGEEVATGKTDIITDALAAVDLVESGNVDIEAEPQTRAESIAQQLMQSYGVGVDENFQLRPDAKPLKNAELTTEPDRIADSIGRLEPVDPADIADYDMREGYRVGEVPVDDINAAGQLVKGVDRVTGEEVYGIQKGEAFTRIGTLEDIDYGAMVDAIDAHVASTGNTEVSDNGSPTEVHYPNRKLGFEFAKSDTPIDGVGDNNPTSFGNIALANAKPGDFIPGVGEVVKISSKTISIKGEDGKVSTHKPTGKKWDALVRDVGGLISSSAHLLPEQYGDAVDMLSRDPAARQVNGAWELVDGDNSQSQTAPPQNDTNVIQEPKETDSLSSMEGKSNRDDFLAEMEKLKADIDAGKVDESQFKDPEPEAKPKNNSKPKGSPQAKPDLSITETIDAVKDEYPGALVGMKMGDFYEFFRGDAETVAKELEITLVGRDMDGVRVPMTGVPFHSVDKYMTTLEANGNNVVLVDRYGMVLKKTEPVAEVVLTDEVKALGLTESAASKKLAELEAKLAALQAKPKKPMPKNSGGIDPDIFEEAWMRAGIAVLKIGVKIETAVYGAMRSLGIDQENYASIKAKVEEFLTPEEATQDEQTKSEKSDTVESDSTEEGADGNRTNQGIREPRTGTRQQAPAQNTDSTSPKPREESGSGKDRGTNREPSEGSDGQLPGASDGGLVANVRPSRGNPATSNVSGRPVDGGREGERGLVFDRDNAGRDFRFSSAKPVKDLHSLGVAARRDKAIEAFQALKEAKAQGYATDEQKMAMALFPGWGPIKQYLNAKDNSAGARKLRASLGRDGYIAAVNAGANSHYTSPEVVEAIWKAVSRLGFEGGKVLEPSAGSGLFYSLMPENLRDASNLTMVELDKMTAEMAEFLYPESTVLGQGYETTRLDPDSYDLIISNVPFAAEPIQDASLLRYIGPAAHAKVSNSVHNFFFAKSIVQAKPGGLVAFITTHGSMDAYGEQSTEFRSWMQEQADFLGAVRLPSSAFGSSAKTEVVTDIVFFRKKGNDALPSVNKSWVDTEDLVIGDRTFKRNKYFGKNPDLVLGRETATGTMRKPYSYNVVANHGFDPTKDVFEAIKKAIGKAKIAPIDAPSDSKPVYDYADSKRVVGEIYVDKNGVIVSKSNDGVEIPMVFPEGKAGANQKAIWKDYLALKDRVDDVLRWQRSDSDADLKKAQAEAVKVYKAFVKKHGELHANKVTVTERKLTEKQLKEYADEGELDAAVESGEIIEYKGEYFRTIETTRWKLRNKGLLTQDTQWAKVFSIERFDYDSNKVVGLGKIFTERVVNAPTQLSIETPADAIELSYNTKGTFDLEFIAGSLGLTESDAIKALGSRVYEKPEGGYSDSTEYLSGNVRKKLREAEKAVANGRVEFQRNVDALLDAQPPYKEFADIGLKLGASFVPAEIYTRFFQDLGIYFNLQKGPQQWIIGKSVRFNESAKASFGSNRVDPELIIRSAMTQSAVPPIYVKIGEESVRDKDAEAIAADQVEKLVGAFEEFLKIDKEAQKSIEENYNETVNVWQKSVTDGSMLKFPGLSSTIEIRPHTLNAIARAMRNPFTYFWHGVGSGKTFTGHMLAMKLKQTGLRKKVMLVAYKPTLGQYSAAFLEAFPDANILVATDDSFSPANREMFLAQVAAGDWDAVIVTQEQMSTLSLSPESVRKYYQRLIDQVLIDYGVDIEGLTDDSTEYDIVKQMVNAGTVGNDRGSQSSMRREIKRLKDAQARAIAEIEGFAEIKKRVKMPNGKYETVTEIVTPDKLKSSVTFETLGIDHIILDEAHMFKGLPIVSEKSLNHSSSKRAENLHMLTQYLQRTGGGFTPMSGTAFVNSFAEAHAILQYLMTPTLRELGLMKFDTWASVYTDSQTKPEVTVDGQLKAVDRVVAFRNVDDMAAMLEQIMDIVPTSAVQVQNSDGSNSQIELPWMENENGVRSDKPIIIEIDPTPGMQKIFTHLGERFVRARENLGKPKDEWVTPDHILSLSTLARQVSQFPGLVTSKLGDEHKAIALAEEPHKVNRMVSEGMNVYREFNNSADIATQIFFVEDGVPGGAADIDLYAMIKKKLIAEGVKLDEIALISDVRNAKDKKKIEEGMNSGRIKFLIGSRPKIGVGMNIQRHLKAVHHMSIGWNPANLEQGNGRVIRFGNLWKDRGVRIYYYVNKGTFDQVTGQKTLQKANFIEQVMNALSGRATGLKTLEAQSTDEGVAAFAEILASSMGDTRVVQLFDLGNQIEVLRRKSEQAISARNIAERRIPNLRDSEIPQTENTIKFLTELSETIDISAGIEEPATAEGKTLADKIDFLLGKTLAAARDGRGEVVQIKFAKSLRLEARSIWSSTDSGFTVMLAVKHQDGTVLRSGKVRIRTWEGQAIDDKELQAYWDSGSLSSQRFSGRAFIPLMEGFSDHQVKIQNEQQRLADQKRNLVAFEESVNKENPYQADYSRLVNELNRLEFEVGIQVSAVNSAQGGGSMFGMKPATTEPATGKVQIPVEVDGKPTEEMITVDVLERNSRGWLWVRMPDGSERSLPNFVNPNSNQKNPPVEDPDEFNYILGNQEWQDQSSEQFKTVIDQLTQVARGAGIQMEPGALRSQGAREVLGKFLSGNPKAPKGKIKTRPGLPNGIIATVLSHEIGHAIDSQLNKKAGGEAKPKGDYGVLFPDIDAKTVEAELKAVTKELVGNTVYASNIKYYNRKTELFARLIESMVARPDLAEKHAPETSAAIASYITDNPFIRDVFLAATRNLPTRNMFKIFADARQEYETDLGRYLGNQAWANEMSYRANRIRAVEVAKALIDEKMKGVKDDPSDLFGAAEGIRSNANGAIEFGTRVYQYLDPSLDEYGLIAGELDENGWWIDNSYDGERGERWVNWRVNPTEAEARFNALSPEGQNVIREFTQDSNEALDVFSREKLKVFAGIESEIEGWVHHYFPDKSAFSPRGGTKKFKQMVAGTRRTRNEAMGYSTDFWAASEKAITDLLVEHEQRKFIADQAALMMEYLAPGEKPRDGWVEVRGDILVGFWADGDRQVLIPVKDGRLMKVQPGGRYQIPATLYERHIRYQTMQDDLKKGWSWFSTLARYWTGNTLIHPATWVTNFISGGLQFSWKLYNDFYLDAMNYEGKRNRTMSNIAAVLGTLTPKGWNSAPGYIYGGLESTKYLEYMGIGKENAIDKILDKALAANSLAESYWKKVIVNSELKANEVKTGKGTKVQLIDPNSKEFLAMVNEKVDLYAFDYQNVPTWMQFLRHGKVRNIPIGAISVLAKPYITYSYKYTKAITNQLGGIFDVNLPWQERVAKIMALSTSVMLALVIKKLLSDEAEADLEIDENTESIDLEELAVETDSRGRTFVGRTPEGNEVYLRTAKYPAINLADLIWGVKTGQGEAAGDVIQDFLGGVGPLMETAMLPMGYRSEYDTFVPKEAIAAEIGASFLPAHRLLKDAADILDPVKRKRPDTPGQVFAGYWPTTNEEWMASNRPEQKTVKLPLTEKELNQVKAAKAAVRDGIASPKQITLLKDVLGGNLNSQRETKDVVVPKSDLALRLRMLGITTKEVNPDWQSRFIGRQKLIQKRESKKKKNDKKD